ncbi:MAG: nucleoside monophosphate kinase [Chloroflexi bacterium]|nr:nucleoside monophosphate kinase [Chloroflexota bacterium]
MYLVLIGPPGAGKGTQAKVLSEQKNLAHVSSGDLFRDNIKRQTELGKQVEAILKRGDLVPDDVTIAMVRDRLKQPDCAAGAVLDGFPRTPAQAAALNKMLGEFGGKVNLVPYINPSASRRLKQNARRVWRQSEPCALHQRQRKVADRAIDRTLDVQIVWHGFSPEIQSAEGARQVR